jgi:hypothetical protein
VEEACQGVDGGNGWSRVAVHGGQYLTGKEERAAVVIGVWGWGHGRRTRGMGCRGSCSANACER